jgi:site-specific recombinase
VQVRQSPKPLTIDTIDMGQPTEHAMEPLAASAAKAATYAGAGASAVGGFALSSEEIALVGLLVAIAGFVISAVFQVRRDRREQREHEARMKVLE